MNTRINAVGMTAPPRRGVAIANPASSLPSSRMAARDRAQSWRGKYLRALNICPEDIENARRLAEKAAQDGKPRVRAMSFHRSDFADHHAFSRSYSSSTEKEEEERKSLEKATQQQNNNNHFQHHHGRHGGAAVRTVPQQHHIQAVPLRAPSAHSGVPTAMPMLPTASNPYGFTMRPDISRGRRCHTDPFLLDERVSAPIQIPSAVRGNNQLDGNDRRGGPFNSAGQRRRASPQSIQIDAAANSSNNHSANVRLLSWEEPVAMLAAADAVSKGWRMPHESEMELGVRRSHGDDLDHVHMEDEEDDTESHGGDIFEMDESEDEGATTIDNGHQVPATSSGKSRRRYRTDSMNVVTSGREKRSHHADDDDETDDHFHGGLHRRGQDLSTSFVPPHQMVDRSNCFSIGLRDEFKKRRPVNHI